MPFDQRSHWDEIHRQELGPRLESAFAREALPAIDPMYGRGTQVGPDTFVADEHLRHFFSVGYVRSLFARSPNLHLRQVSEEQDATSSFVKVSAVAA